MRDRIGDWTLFCDSFSQIKGVLLWELFTYGKIPYAELPNQDVLKHVTNGNRLEKPPLCPDDIYDVMTQCWNVHPNERPTFKAISDSLRKHAVNSDQPMSKQSFEDPSPIYILTDLL